MTLVEKIFNCFKNNESFSLQEAYEHNLDKPQETVRARIYEKIGVKFERVAKGVYRTIDCEEEQCVLIEGDGRDLSMIEDNSIDCILTDHPWLDMKSNKGGTRAFALYDCFRYTLEDFKEKARVLKDGCFLVEVLPAENENNYEYLYQIKQYAKEAGFVYYSKVPWKKGNFVSNTGRKAKNTQDIMIFSKGKARNMRIDILSVMPEMLESPLHCSILQRAQDKGLVEIHVHNLRDWSLRKHKKVDDYPFSGEAGMVMQIEPVHRCIEHLMSERHYDEVIFTSPDGDILDQPMANSLSLAENIIILCGHYKGVDYRIREHLITKEISIGNYVLTGGELPAAVIADSIVRLIPGAIGDEQSALNDSFQDNLLEAPVYTRPADYNGWKVPEILLSGNQAKIEEWKMQQALERTKRLRPDLLKD